MDKWCGYSIPDSCCSSASSFYVFPLSIKRRNVKTYRPLIILYSDDSYSRLSSERKPLIVADERASEENIRLG